MSQRSIACALVVAGLLFLPRASGAVVTRNMELKANLNDYPPTGSSPFGAGYASCWSYVHGDGREYAVIGTTKGTAIYNVTVPEATSFVSFIPGISSAWREMKSYRNWIYVVTEGVTSAGGDPVVPPGVQIISMVNPESPVVSGYWTGSFNHSHSVSVDTTRALLVCNGTRNGMQQQTGMRILSLADPVNPVEVGWWPGGAIPVDLNSYVHDSVPIGDRLYASSIYSGIQRVIDVSTVATPTELSSWTYPGAFSHNAWPDTSGNVLYVTDEVNGEPLKVFDISGLPPTPPLANTLTSNPLAIVHNAHVMGDELYLANYTEGIRILDISDPLHPAEFAYADSYPGGSGGYYGVWGLSPYFPSGTVIASDMQVGLLVYRPVRDYGLIHVRVTDGALPIADAKVYVTTASDSASTPADGTVRFASNPGSHTVKATKFGCYDAMVTLPVSVGSLDTVTLVLVPKPTTMLSGLVIDDGTLAFLEGAEVDLRYTPVHEHTEVDGAYAITGVPAELYRVEVRRPGYIPLAFDHDFPPDTSVIDFRLRPTASWDALESASGWVVGAAGDNASSGLWTRANPVGTSSIVGGGGEAQAPRARDLEGVGPGIELDHEGHEADGASPGQVAPEDDRSPGAGAMCFVTGQGTNPSNIGEADVDGGRTTLTSPTFNLSGMSDPVLGYWVWFYTQFGHTDDWLATSISNNNGASWVPVDTTRALRNHWVERAIRVSDFVTPTSQVKVRFAAADNGIATVVEAAIDDVVLYDRATLVGVDGARVPSRLALRSLGSNPARGAVAFSLETPAARDADVAVFDVSGRRVRTLWRGRAEAGALRLVWDGATDAGREAPAGLYFARVVAGAEAAQARFIRIGR